MNKSILIIDAIDAIDSLELMSEVIELINIKQKQLIEDNEKVDYSNWPISKRSISKLVENWNSPLGMLEVA